MIELVVVLVFLASPVGLKVINVNDAVVTPISTASALVWPGYVVSLWLWPRSHHLPPSRRLAFAPALSSVSIIVIGILSWITLGRATYEIVMTYLLIIVAALTVWVGANWRAPREAAVSPLRVSREFAGACAIFATLAVIAGLAASPQAMEAFGAPEANERFTSFYVLGSEGLTEDYPREVVANQRISPTVGVANHEGLSTSYTVRVQIGDQVIGLSPIISLAPGEVWEQPVTFAIPVAGYEQEIELILERDGNPVPYRTLRLWINVNPRETQYLSSPARPCPVEKCGPR